MKENQQFVKWYVFWSIMLVVFSCIGSLFSIQSSMKTEYRDYVLDIKQDVATVKESVEWLKDFKPNLDRGEVSFNPYTNVEKTNPDELDIFINNLEEALKNKED